MTPERASTFPSWWAHRILSCASGSPPPCDCTATTSLKQEMPRACASNWVTRALVLIPSGGFLSTATRAQRLGATAVIDELPAETNLWEILRKAARDADA